MVGSQDNPATEAIAQVDDGHTATETHDTGQRHPQRGDQDLQRAKGTTVKAMLTTQLLSDGREDLTNVARRAAESLERAGPTWEEPGTYHSWTQLDGQVGTGSCGPAQAQGRVCLW